MSAGCSTYFIDCSEEAPEIGDGGMIGDPYPSSIQSDDRISRFSTTISPSPISRPVTIDTPVLV